MPWISKMAVSQSLTDQGKNWSRHMSNLQFVNMLTKLSHSHIIFITYLIITLSHHHIITLSHYKSKHEEQVQLCKPERARGLNAFCEKGFDIIIIIIVIIIIIIINIITLQGLKHRRRPSRTKDPNISWNDKIIITCVHQGDTSCQCFPKSKSHQFGRRIKYQWG